MALRETMDPQAMSLDTLEKLQSARNYNQWILALCRPFLGRRVLEIGSGIGNMTGYLLEGADRAVLATDIDPDRLDRLRRRWPGEPRLATAVWDAGEEAPESVAAFRPDTVVCINILEHLRDDAAALERMHGLLPPAGRMVLFLPALETLYGSLDRMLSHYRRYNRGALAALLAAGGFQIERLHYVNSLGIFGWWLNGRILKRTRFSENQIRLFDRLVPALSRVETFLKPPLGQSLFAVARK